MFHYKPHFYSTGSDYCIVAIGKPKWQVCKASHSVSKQQQRSPYAITLLLFVRATCIYGCCSSRTSRSWWITYSMQRQRRGCNNMPSLSQQTTPIIHSFLQSLLLARPSHPGHSTILLRSESLSGKCAKLHTVAANNNRSPDEITLLLLVCITYTCVLFFAHIPFVVNRAFTAMPIERLQQYDICSQFSVAVSMS